MSYQITQNTFDNNGVDLYLKVHYMLCLILSKSPTTQLFEPCRLESIVRVESRRTLRCGFTLWLSLIGTADGSTKRNGCLDLDFDGVLHPDAVFRYRNPPAIRLQAPGTNCSRAPLLDQLLAPYPGIRSR
jgi:hypothetical protein